MSLAAEKCFCGCAKTVPLPHPRPGRRSQDCLIRVATALKADLETWTGGSISDSYLEELAKILGLSHSWDAYALAKEMERAGYAPDENLVDILEGISGLAFEAQRLLAAEWVRTSNLKPAFHLGQTVRFQRHQRFYLGEITNINLKEASYTIFVESEGHVREGMGCHGWILNFEDARCVTCGNPGYRIDNIFLHAKDGSR